MNNYASASTPAAPPSHNSFGDDDWGDFAAAAASTPSSTPHPSSAPPSFVPPTATLSPAPSNSMNFFGPTGNTATPSPVSFAPSGAIHSFVSPVSSPAPQQSFSPAVQQSFAPPAAAPSAHVDDDFEDFAPFHPASAGPAASALAFPPNSPIPPLPVAPVSNGPPTIIPLHVAPTPIPAPAAPVVEVDQRGFKVIQAGLFSSTSSSSSTASPSGGATGGDLVATLKRVEAEASKVPEAKAPVDIRSLLSEVEIASPVVAPHVEITSKPTVDVSALITSSFQQFSIEASSSFTSPPSSGAVGVMPIMPFPGSSSAHADDEFGDFAASSHVGNDAGNTGTLPQSSAIDDDFADFEFPSSAPHTTSATAVSFRAPLNSLDPPITPSLDSEQNTPVITSVNPHQVASSIITTPPPSESLNFDASSPLSSSVPQPAASPAPAPTVLTTSALFAAAFGSATPSPSSAAFVAPSSGSSPSSLSWNMTSATTEKVRCILRGPPLQVLTSLNIIGFIDLSARGEEGTGLPRVFGGQAEAYERCQYRGRTSLL